MTMVTVTIVPSITMDTAARLRHGAEVHFTGPSGRHPLGQPCSRDVGPRGGITVHIVRARVSGQLRLWARQPGRFRLPVARGLYEHGEITDSTARWWHRAEDCPIRQEEEASSCFNPHPIRGAGEC